MALSPLVELYRAQALRRGRPAPERIEDLLDEDEKKGMLRNLANAGASGLSGLGWLLDTPGSIVRGGLSDGPWKALSALWETSDQRVSGRELLRKWGGTGREDNWRNFGTGLLTEVALDPLTYASLGLGPLLGAAAKTAAGRFGARAGLFSQDLGLAAKKFSEEAAKKAAATGGTFAPIGKAQLLRRPATDLLSVMPSWAAKEAREKMVALGGKEILDQPLTASHRLGIPFLYSGARDLFGKRFGDATAKAADWLGTTAAATPVLGAAIRGAQGLFDSKRMGFTDEAGQWLGRDLTQRSEWLQEKARRSVSRAMTSAARAVGEDVFRTPVFADAVRDAVEGYAPRAARALAGQFGGVKAWKDMRKPFEDLVQTIKRWQKAQIKAADKLGVRLDARMKLPNQLEYMFRQATQVDNPRVDPRYAYKGGVPYDRGVELLGLGSGARKRRGYAEALPTWLLNQMSTDGALQTALRNAPDTDIRKILDSWIATNGRQFQRKIQDVPGVYVGPYDYLKKNVDPTDFEALKQAHIAIEDRYSGLADKLRSLPLQHAADKVPMFGNSLNDIAMQMLSRGRGNASAEVALEMLAKAKVNTPARRVDGGTNWTLRKALKELGFDTRLRTDAQGNLIASRGEAALANMLGIPVTTLPAYSVPKQLVEQLLTKNMAARVPREAKGLLKVYDNFLQSFKSLALLWPSVRVRDTYSGSFASATKGALHPLLRDQFHGAAIGRGSYEGIPAAVRHLPEYQSFATPGRLDQLRNSAPKYAQMTPEQLTDELFIRKFLSDGGGQGLTSGSVVDDLGRSADNLGMNETAPGLAGGYFRGLWGKMKRRPIPYDLFWSQRTRNGNPNWLLDFGDRTARASDSFNRIGAYLNRIRKGDAPRAAKGIADLTQVNYHPSAFTGFEREFMKRLIPFYSYTKGIAPLVLGDLVNQPAGLMGKSIRAISRASEPGEETFVPEYMRQSAAIPIGSEVPFLGIKTPGISRFLTNIDLPHEGFINLFSPGIGNTLSGRISNSIMKTGQNILGQSSPVLKGPLEYVLNRQFFTGRQLSDLYSMLEHDFGPIGRPAEQILSNAPGGSRVLGTIRQLRDDRISFPERLAKFGFNALTGLKVQDVDQVKTARLAARGTLNELLDQAPGMHVYENITIKPEDFVNLSQREKEQYILYRVLQAEAARVSREKKKAQKTAFGNSLRALI